MSNTIVAFGASSSKKSINKRFARYTAQQIANSEIIILDLNDFEMSIFSVDREKESGIPDLAHKFKDYMKKADGIIISFAEHNGSYSAAFKNILDWVSRIDGNIWMNKPMLLLATSPGNRGGRTVLDIGVNKLKFMNTNTIVHFSLPSFYKNFSEDTGISDETILGNYTQQLEAFKKAI